MSPELLAILGGTFLAAFIIFPFGAATTSGSYRPQPFSWAKWRHEASVSLWAMTPKHIFRDVYRGYSSVLGGLVRLFAALACAVALSTAAALVGWGLFSWLLR